MIVKNLRQVKRGMEADVIIWTEDNRQVVLRVTVAPNDPRIKDAVAALQAGLHQAAYDAIAKVNTERPSP